MMTSDGDARCRLSARYLLRTSMAWGTRTNICWPATPKLGVCLSFMSGPTGVARPLLLERQRLSSDHFSQWAAWLRTACALSLGRSSWNSRHLIDMARVLAVLFLTGCSGTRPLSYYHGNYNGIFNSSC